MDVVLEYSGLVDGREVARSSQQEMRNRKPGKGRALRLEG